MGIQAHVPSRSVLDTSNSISDWVKRSNHDRTKTSVSRDPETYRGFPHAGIGEQTPLSQWLKACHITPLSAIEWVWTASHHVKARVLNDSMWFYFSQVDGRARIGNETFRIQPGSLLLIPRGVEHEVLHEHGEAHLYAVHFRANVYGEINLLDLLGYPYHIVADKSDSFLESVSKRIAREFALKAPGWDTAIATDLMMQLLYILRTSGDDFRPLAGGGAQSDLPRLLPVLVWIQDNLFNSKCRVSDMAQKINICEGQFRKLFRRTIGCSPVHFVQRQRMERACFLLLTTDMPISHIAEACGFSDVPFFYRVFQKWVTVSPRKYRLRSASGKREAPNP